MSVWAEIAAQISDTTGDEFEATSWRSVGGGCINRGWRLASGSRAYFVKLNQADLGDMFAAEAEALSEIRATGTVRAPEPVCVGGNASSAWLVLEFIELAAPREASARTLGVRLAGMHTATRSEYGWHRDNTIGTTPQNNTPASNWAAFWADQRLRYQLDLAAENGHRGRLQESGAKLLERVPSFFATYRPSASLLHGDLWGGNVGYGACGEGVVFDPASYYGDRETDIAMSELFGGFPEAFYRGYESVWPLDPGYRVRSKLYKLYHVLNHLNLFGIGYRAQAESLIAELLATC